MAPRTQDSSAPRSRAVGDPSPLVALVAIRAVGEAADVAAAPELHRRPGTGSAELADAIEEALTKIFRSNVIAFLDPMMGEDRPVQLAAGVRVLGGSRGARWRRC